MNALDIKSDDIETRVALNVTTLFEPDMFFDGDRFMSHLRTKFAAFDVITYSNSKSYKRPISNIRRLIYGLRQAHTNIDARERRFVPNNHVKMFICYSAAESTSSTDVYIGSQNLTHSTNLNIMYRARLEHVPALIEFFNLLWKNS